MGTLRVESLTLEGVGIFGERFTAQFAADGVTVVHGPNEAGKSTLLAGIPAVIFGVPTGDLKHWRTDPERAVCCGVVVLRAGDDRYTITRDFLKHRVQVTDGDGTAVFDGDANPGGRGTDTRAYRAWLTASLGIEESDAFKETAFLHLRDHETPFAYGNTVRELVSGAGAEDFTDVEQVLLSEFDALTKVNPWGTRAKSKNREIETAREQLDNLRTTLVKAEAAARDMRHAQEGLSAADADHAAAHERATAARYTLERLREIQRLRSQLTEAEDRQRRAQRDQARTAELGRAVAGLDAQLQRDFADISGVTESTVTAMDDAERAAGEAEEVQAQAMAQPDPAAPTLNVTPVLAVAGVALGLGVALSFVSLWIGLGVGVAGLVVAALLYHQASRRHAEARVAFERAAEARQDAVSRAERVQAAASAAWSRVPDAVRAFTSAQLRARLHERALVQRERDAKRETLDALPDAPTLDAAVRDATRDVAKMDLRLEELGAQQVPPAQLAVQLQETERALAEAERAMADADERRREANRALGRTEHASFPATAVLAEDIADLQERLAALEQRRDALHVAIDTLRDAAGAFQRDHVGPIGAEATDLLCALTEGDWTVRLSHEGLSPELTWRGRPWDVARLSAGTADQLAVALRLAVVRALHATVRLPLILDDPLAHWDAARRDAFRDTLRTLAREHQVILATPDASLADWGAAAIDLRPWAALAPKRRADYTRP